MARDAKYDMSQARLDELKEELLYVQTVREKEVAEQLKEARSFGDLSENSEYEEAKTEQGKLYSRKAELLDLIENANLVEATTDTTKVGMGSKITVQEVEIKSKKKIRIGDPETYQIVGSQEAEPGRNRISDASPFGKALVGRAVGDKVEVDAPGGKILFEILEIGLVD
ncbi:MAG: transcription elongation factor GreA [Oscillospiraceae bacterium]|jgi:transcription elongation factor GreA|nr:transcription elongation factor GreA [Oscillospiraceae bacterium]